MKLKSDGNKNRSTINKSALINIGIPREYAGKTYKDYIFKEVSLKTFVKEYLEKAGNVLMYGSNGTGKTLLACLLLQTFYVKRFSCKRINLSSYIELVTSSWDDKEKVAEKEEFKKYDFLVIDEIGKEIKTSLVNPLIEELLRHRIEKDKNTILITNLPLETLFEEFGASIESILKGNFTPIKMVGKDKRKEKK